MNNCTNDWRILQLWMHFNALIKLWTCLLRVCNLFKRFEQVRNKVESNLRNENWEPLRKCKICCYECVLNLNLFCMVKWHFWSVTFDWTAFRLVLEAGNETGRVWEWILFCLILRKFGSCDVTSGLFKTEPPPTSTKLRVLRHMRLCQLPWFLGPIAMV